MTNDDIQKKLNEINESLQLVLDSSENHTINISEISEQLVKTNSILHHFTILQNQNNHFLNKACSDGNLEDVKKFIAKGANIRLTIEKHNYFFYKNYKNIDATPLTLAAAKGNLDVVNYLLTIENEVDKYHPYALSLASHEGHLEIVKALVKSGCDIHSMDSSPLFGAGINNHLPVVKYLIEECGASTLLVVHDTTMRHQNSWLSDRHIHKDVRSWGTEYKKLYAEQQEIEKELEIPQINKSNKFRL